MTISEKQIFCVLTGIEKGEIKISMRPDQDIWMGSVIYDIANGWVISIFSDCFCWDYIEKIWDDHGNLIYEYDPQSPLSDYECGEEVAENIYKIFDPFLRKCMLEKQIIQTMQITTKLEDECNHKITCNWGDLIARCEHCSLLFKMPQNRNEVPIAMQEKTVETIYESETKLTNKSPKPKYKIGDLAWVLGEDNRPAYKEILDIYLDTIYMEYIYVVTDCTDDYINITENSFYQTKEALIDSQIKYWTCLKKQERSTGSEDVSMQSKECKHESDGWFYPHNEVPLFPPNQKCKHCGEFYR